MNDLFADRVKNVPRSFVREILKVTENPEIISFAGGLPNPKTFPVKEIARATEKVLSNEGSSALQYSTTEGYGKLRDYIAKRYARIGLKVGKEEVLITNGSQQCIDLTAKVLINKDDGVLMEKPTYLAAIQSFSLFEPQFHTIPLIEDGVNPVMLRDILGSYDIKLFYSVTSFQNPSGISYSKENRKEVAEIINESDTVFVEDNPYGELRFIGEDLSPVKSYLDNSILFGSFSKIVSPGMRLGWIVAHEEIMEKLIIAKQASDLHSNYFTQRVVYQYLVDNHIDDHINRIRKLYKRQRDKMVEVINDTFPPEVKYTQPEGGMFLWVTLPEGTSSLELFDMALKENVAFVPGQAFYVKGGGENSLRLNFSNSDEDKIEEGIKRLARAVNQILSQK
ncbi:MAG: PLP-dependent aminotransferase family protein [Methanobacteriaceae archaeon]|nr:PLP-dependent aminotransferase family protein [Methanobacteriaceae archaeon]